MSTLPKRSVVLTACIQADSIHDLCSHLLNLAADIEIGGESQGQSISGGVSSSHFLELSIDSNMTHDIYFEQIRAHLAGAPKPGAAHHDAVPARSFGAGVVELLSDKEAVSVTPQATQVVTTPADRANEMQPEVIDVRLGVIDTNFGPAADTGPHGPSFTTTTATALSPRADSAGGA